MQLVLYIEGGKGSGASRRGLCRCAYLLDLFRVPLYSSDAQINYDKDWMVGVFGLDDVDEIAMQLHAEEVKVRKRA